MSTASLTARISDACPPVRDRIRLLLPAAVIDMKKTKSYKNTGLSVNTGAALRGKGNFPTLCKWAQVNTATVDELERSWLAF
jgi:hypothetical protein